MKQLGSLAMVSYSTSICKEDRSDSCSKHLRAATSDKLVRMRALTSTSLCGMLAGDEPMASLSIF